MSSKEYLTNTLIKKAAPGQSISMGYNPVGFAGLSDGAVKAPDWGKKIKNFYKKNQDTVDTAGYFVPFVGAGLSGRDTLRAAKDYGNSFNQGNYRQAAWDFARMMGNGLLTAADFVGVGPLARGGVRGAVRGTSAASKALKGVSKSRKALLAAKGTKQYATARNAFRANRAAALAARQARRQFLPDAAKVSAKQADLFQNFMKRQAANLTSRYGKAGKDAGKNLISQGRYARGLSGRVNAPFRGLHTTGLGAGHAALMKIPGAKRVFKYMPQRGPFSGGYWGATGRGTAVNLTGHAGNAVTDTLTENSMYNLGTGDVRDRFGNVQEALDFLKFVGGEGLSDPVNEQAAVDYLRQIGETSMSPKPGMAHLKPHQYDWLMRNNPEIYQRVRQEALGKQFPVRQQY